MRAEEAVHVVRYFHGLSDGDLERMGVVARAELPEPGDWERRLVAVIDVAPQAATSAYFTWFVDGAPVGFSSLKDLRTGGEGRMHLHMWSAAHRGQGHGAWLFCATALQAYDRFQLRRILCEPKADNPMPNRMLARVGFPLLGTRDGRSSELSRVTRLNQHDIRRDVAEAYLRAHPGR